MILVLPFQAGISIMQLFLPYPESMGMDAWITLRLCPLCWFMLTGVGSSFMTSFSGAGLLSFFPLFLLAPFIVLLGHSTLTCFILNFTVFFQHSGGFGRQASSFKYPHACLYT